MRSSYRRNRLARDARKQQRPFGVALLATLGVLGSLLLIVTSLSRLWALTSAGAGPDRQVAVLCGVLVFGLVALWINWGFWELIRWAWWANLILSLLAVAGYMLLTRYVPVFAETVARMRPDIPARQITSSILVSNVIGLAYNLIAIVYMISVHTAFGVGVKEERPLWERAQRH